METNVIQKIILVLVGFAILFVGFLLFLTVCGEPTPEYIARLKDLFGWFAWFVMLIDNTLRGLAGAALMWIGYKIYPFKDEECDEEQVAENEIEEQDAIIINTIKK